MTSRQQQDSKQLYKELRALPWSRLWGMEVARFDRASPEERLARVAVVRAVGVVFSEAGPADGKDAVKQWLLRLLHDPAEKIRRYAMAALPKIGAGASEETELLTLLQNTTIEREEKFLAQTLGRIGGVATLEAGALSPSAEQKVRAAVAREQGISTVRLDRENADFARLRIHLRCRRGLERIVREEVEEQGKFRLLAMDPGLVAITPLAPFTLADLTALRCYDTTGFVLGLVKQPGDADAIAAAITSPLSQRLLGNLTNGPIRYRLEFVGKGHQRGAVRQVVDDAYARSPAILNDARQSPWAVDIHPTRHGDSVELRPRWTPDPRHAWRTDDVPAASHPPLAACLARLAGRMDDEVVWDPFCGSGLELVERALRGGASKVIGTDRSAAAIDISKANFAAAPLPPTPASFICCDFRDFASIPGLGPGAATLLITNPPLGRRVRVPNLHALFDDLFAAAATVLRPGGRLVFTNPFRMESPQPSLKLEYRQVVDLGGFDCRVEVYRKGKPKS